MKTLFNCSIGILLLFTSCSSNDGLINTSCGNGTWLESVQTELNTWVNAIQTYSADPSPANCQNYKSAAQAYINELNNIKDCVPSISLLDFEDALEEALVELNALHC